MNLETVSASSQSDGVPDEVELKRDWEPLSAPDYAVLAFSGTWQIFALVVCVHLLLNRQWPPYVTKNVTLVIITVSHVHNTLPLETAMHAFRYMSSSFPLS